MLPAICDTLDFRRFREEHCIITFEKLRRLSEFFQTLPKQQGAACCALALRPLHCNISKFARLAQIFQVGGLKLSGSVRKSVLTTKDTKSTKFGILFIRALRVLRDLRGENSFPFGCGSAALSSLRLNAESEVYFSRSSTRNRSPRQSAAKPPVSPERNPPGRRESPKRRSKPPPHRRGRKTETSSR